MPLSLSLLKFRFRNLHRLQLNWKTFQYNFSKFPEKNVSMRDICIFRSRFLYARRKKNREKRRGGKKIAKSYIACQKHVHVKRKFPLLNTPCSPPVPFSRSNSYDEKSRTGHIFSSKKLYKVKTESLNDKEFAGNNRAHDYTVIFRYAPNRSSTSSPFPFSLSLTPPPYLSPSFSYSPVAFNASALNFRSKR